MATENEITEASGLPLSTSDVTAEVAIRMGDGAAGEEPVTLMQNWDMIVAKHGDKPALHQKNVRLSVCHVMMKLYP